MHLLKRVILIFFGRITLLYFEFRYLLFTIADFELSPSIITLLG